MNQKFEVRPAVEGDFAKWLPLWDGYNAFYGRSGVSALPSEVTQTTWLRFLDIDEPMHALVAQDDSGLLGLAHFLFHRSTIRLGMTCYLQDLYTVERARGRGVATALIDDVYRRAKAAGSAQVYWQTHESNNTAMKLYGKVAQRSGFVVYRKAL